MNQQIAAFVLCGEHWVFRAGREDYVAARSQATCCEFFTEDDEDEQVDDVLCSCYNCAYRRWLADSFHCTKL